MSASPTEIESVDAQGHVDLEFTQDLRKRLIDKLAMKDGALQVPGESSEKIMLMQLLDGADKQVISKAKLRASEKAAKANENAAALVAQALREMNANTYVPPVSPEQKTTEVSRSKPFVPGEQDITVDPLSMAQIMKPANT